MAEWKYINPSHQVEKRNIYGEAYTMNEPYTFEQSVEEINKKFKTKLTYVDVGADVSRVSIDGSIRFSVKTLDGMCGVMKVYEKVMYEAPRKEWVSAMDALAKWGNYTKIMVTDRLATANAFEKLGFRNVEEFQNRRTGNTVAILLRDVPYDVG